MGSRDPQKEILASLASLAKRPSIQITNELVAIDKMVGRLAVVRGLALGVFVTTWPLALFATIPSSLAYTLYLVGVGAAVALIASTDTAWTWATKKRALLATIAARAVHWEMRQKKREGAKA